MIASTGVNLEFSGALDQLGRALAEVLASAAERGLPAEISDHGDYLLVTGTLSPDERQQLELTHIEQHQHGCGIVWLPKEAGDDS